jgi:hypothetical protein
MPALRARLGFILVTASALAALGACVQPKPTGEPAMMDDAGSSYPDVALAPASEGDVTPAGATDGPGPGAADATSDTSVGTPDAPPPVTDGLVSGAAVGTSCQDGHECAGGFCADGVCCNEACAGQCQACDLPGNLGTCLPVTGAPHGPRPHCDGSAPCAGACDGKEPSACQYPGASTSCGAPHCADGVATTAATCDGHGGCGKPRQITCAPDPCDGDACGQCSPTRPCATGFQCTSGKCEPKLDPGKGCQSDGQCKSGHCQQDVCCDRACTGACEACNLPDTAGKCTFTSANVCRASTGACDVAETCDGSSAACPPDLRRPGGTTCRASTGACDVAETCDGSSAACPPDLRRPAGTTCRAAAGTCDLPETCDGQTPDCPLDVKQPNGATCRPATGACDVAETCDGSSALCPTDGYRPSGFSCRASAGLCDPAETCDGQSPACPLDLKQPNGATCRPAAGTCDLAETCDGTSAACPPDARRSGGAVCHASTGGCDPAETCDGTSVSCPADVAGCTNGSYCAGTSCAPKKSDGQTCKASNECLGGTCGGRCCSGGCVCPQPSGGNMITNPSFDTDQSGWIVQFSTDTHLYAEDQCAYSHSLFTHGPEGDGVTIHQCVPVTEAGSYNFGIKVKMDSPYLGMSGGNDRVDCTAVSYADSTCTNGQNAYVTTSTLWNMTGWHDVGGTVAVGAGDHSVIVSCTCLADAAESYGIDCLWDMAYLNRGSGTF